jgi:hypothetical protein
MGRRSPHGKASLLGSILWHGDHVEARRSYALCRGDGALDATPAIGSKATFPTTSATVSS